MTPIDAFERALPDVLAELGRRDASDLVEEVLDRTAAMPQRSRWRTASWWAGRLRLSDGFGGPLPNTVRIAIVALLVAALLGTIGVIGALLQRRQVEPPRLTPGTWQAEQPLSMNFGDPSGPAELTLTVTDDQRLLVSSTPHGLVAWLRGSIDVERPGVVRITTTPWTSTGRGKDDGVTVDLDDGQGRRLLEPCLAGDVGRYVWRDDSGHRWSVLTSLGDACPARAAVLTGGNGTDRTWFASATLDGRATAMFDTFDPPIAVVLPGTTEYRTSSTSASVTATATDGSVTLRAFLDPKPFRDPCDARSGWVPNPGGRPNLVDALNASSVFVVTDERTGLVDGRPAHFGRVEVAAPNRCDGPVYGAWQGASETTGMVRSIEPGEHVFLAEVTDPAWTVLLDVTLSGDPPDGSAADAIFATVRFTR